MIPNLIGREWAAPASSDRLPVYDPAPFAFFPFSGWKGSFYGDLHIHGTDGVDFYTRKKVVVSRW